MDHLLIYAGLFAASLAAATVFPFQSEVVLFGLLQAEHYAWWLLVLVATAGNVLGSVVNWVFGRFLTRYQNRRWFPISADTLTQAESWYRRWGKWSLLLSWAPFVGDPLTMVAGVLRESLATFLVLVTVAKTARYLMVAAFSLEWF